MNTDDESVDTMRPINWFPSPTQKADYNIFRAILKREKVDAFTEPKFHDLRPSSFSLEFPYDFFRLPVVFFPPISNYDTIIVFVQNTMSTRQVTGDGMISIETTLSHTHTTGISPYWTRSDLTGPDWTRLNHLGPDKTILGHTVPD